MMDAKIICKCGEILYPVIVGGQWQYLFTVTCNVCGKTWELIDVDLETDEDIEND